MDQDFDFEEIGKQAFEALSARFKNSSILTSEGWHGRVHIKMVSPEFDGVPDDKRQDLVWEVLRESLRENSNGVSLVLPFGMDEV